MTEDVKKTQDEDGLSFLEGLGAVGATGLGIVGALNRKQIVKNIGQYIKPKLGLLNPDLQKPLNLQEKGTTALLVDKPEVLPAPIQKSVAESLVNVTAERQVLDDVAERVKKNPLTMGGLADPNSDAYGIGSALYDFVALNTPMKAKPIQYWEEFFKRDMRLKYTGKNGTMYETKVRQQEVEDANIAVYDDKNKLVSGALYELKNSSLGADAVLGRTEILDMIFNSPISRIKTLEYGTKNVAKTMNSFIDDIDELKEALGSVEVKGINLAKRADYALFELENKLSEGIREGYSFSHLTTLLNEAKRVQDAGFFRGYKKQALDDFIKKNNPKAFNFNEIMKNSSKLAKTFDRNKRGQNAIPQDVYGGYDRYRVKGGDDYFETIAYIDNELIKNLDPNLRSIIKHFQNDVRGEQLLGQLMHIRGTTRRLENSKERVLMIDEMQFDNNQVNQEKVINIRNRFVDMLKKSNPKLFEATDADIKIKKKQLDKLNPDELEALKKEKKEQLILRRVNEAFKKELPKIRVNPFNREGLDKLAFAAKLKANDQSIYELAIKGSKMNREELNELKRIVKQNEYLKTIDLKTSKPPRVTETENINYMPFQKKEEWARYGVNLMLKKAAKQGLDWVGVTPFERGHYKAAKSVGNAEFYGNYEGKGTQTALEMTTKRGIKKTPGKQATIPQQMRVLAEKYGLDPETDIKPIRVAKSNPDKPYKTTKNVQVWNPIKGKEETIVEHVSSHKYNFQGTKKISKEDPNAYFTVYAMRVKPWMTDLPMPVYRQGGLAVNLFKE